MMSILTLILMVGLVATMRPAPGARPQRPAKKGDTLTLGRGVKVGPPIRDPKKPGVVTYELMNDHKLPSRSMRVLRRLMRPLNATGSWVRRGFRSGKTDTKPGNSRTAARSVELQNFLDARNREIARRKSDDGDKRGPEDTLH